MKTVRVIVSCASFTGKELPEGAIVAMTPQQAVDICTYGRCIPAVDDAGNPLPVEAATHDMDGNPLAS